MAQYEEITNKWKSGKYKFLCTIPKHIAFGEVEPRSIQISGTYKDDILLITKKGGHHLYFNRGDFILQEIKDDKYKVIPLETYDNMIKQVNLLADKCEDQKKFIMKYIDLNTTERDELEELRTLKKLLDNDDTTIKQTLQRVEKILK